MRRRHLLDVAIVATTGALVVAQPLASDAGRDAGDVAAELAGREEDEP